jgi:rubrerythrin
MTMSNTAQLSTTRHVRFNASEILEIAEQIKCYGASFYYKAVGLFADPETRNMLLELANWQTEYEDIFADMRKQLFEQNREIEFSEFEYDTLPNVRAMAGLTVFAIKPYPPQQLTGHESKQEILKKAVKNELDIIIFLRGLKDYFALDQAARDEIDDIIKEDMRLIDILKQLPEEALVGEPSVLIPLRLVG